MSWERDDVRGLAPRVDWASKTPQPQYPSDAATLKQFPEARVRHLAAHLDLMGRLNIYILAAEWGLTPLDVIQWLTALHHEGLFERTDESPYFRVPLPEYDSEKQ